MGPDIDLSKANLDEHEKAQLRELLAEYEDVFVNKDNILDHTTVVEHKLKLKHDEAPFKARLYRTSPNGRVIMDQEVKKLLDQGVIRPSNSPWCAPVILVKKSDLSWRFCVTPTRLNNP